MGQIMDKQQRIRIVESLIERDKESNNPCYCRDGFTCYPCECRRDMNDPVLMALAYDFMDRMEGGADD